MTDDRDPPHAPEPDPVELSEEESTVLVFVDGAGSIDDLSASTGVEVDRLRGVLGRLASLGLLEGAPAELTAPPLATPASEPAIDLPVEDAIDLPVEDAIDLPVEDLVDLASEDAAADATEDAAAEAAEADRAAAQMAAEDALEPARDPTREEDVVAAPLPEEHAAEATTGEADEPTRAVVDADHRKRFEAELRPLPPDRRAELAATSGDGPTLSALCFDPDVAVIRALFGNPNAGLEQARLAAFHHRSMTGLDVVATRGDLLRDAQVQRRLLRNPMLGEALLRRLLKPRRLIDVYKITNDRDVPERTRGSARRAFRQKFTTAEPEERCELIWATEGRALVALSGCTFDSRTTAMLCGRPVLSIQLIQSLARFPATPPMILSHLLKQPLVKRQPHLRNMLLQHPNVPSDAKRRS